MTYIPSCPLCRERICHVCGKPLDNIRVKTQFAIKEGWYVPKGKTCSPECNDAYNREMYRIRADIARLHVKLRQR